MSEDALPPPIGPAHVIVLSTGTVAHQNAVHAIVKAHASQWWHQLPEVWIAEGRSATYWRDLIKPVLGLSPAQVLVLRLPDDANRRAWAATFAGPKTWWLHEAYRGRPAPKQVIRKRPVRPRLPPSEAPS